MGLNAESWVYPLLAAAAAVTSCTTVRPPSPAALELDVPVVRQKPDRCGPAMLSAVYRYWGTETTETDVAERIFNPEARGTQPGMLLADARSLGWRASLGPGDPAFWEEALAARVPVICLQPAPDALHFVVLQGHDEGRFLVNDGSGRLRWTAGRDLAGAKTLSICVWPRDYDFDPSPAPPHDLP